MPLAYYNEFEPYAAAWLRNLIGEGLIPHGDVDERDIPPRKRPQPSSWQLTPQSVIW